MRKLGKGHSLAFCVPEEIRISMSTRKLKNKLTPVTVADVLSWVVSETFIDMRRSIPLWAVQGRRYERHRALWEDACVDGETRFSKDAAECFLEDESQSLKVRYQPVPGSSFSLPCEEPMSKNKNIDLISERCREFNCLEQHLVTLQEEQERELSPEIEQERQVEKPTPALPALHHIHKDLIAFVHTGTLVDGSPAYGPAFKTLQRTSAAEHLDVSEFPQGLLATADFANTIQTSGKRYKSDSCQRPVQWILTSTTRGSPGVNTVKHMIIISPYEANELHSAIGASEVATLHIYAPRLNLGFCSLDSLDLYTVPKRQGPWDIPRSVTLQLALFSGQLYLSSFEEYREICDLLGLAWEKAGDGWIVAADGFIIQGGVQQKTRRSNFTNSPVKFLKVLMTKVRRDCEGISKTHMGTILEGSLLGPSDFEKPDG